MGIFYWEKAFHTRKKKSGKMTLPPLKKFAVMPLPIHTPRWGEASKVKCLAQGAQRIVLTGLELKILNNLSLFQENYKTIGFCFT